MVSSEFHLPSHALFSVRSRTLVLTLRLATKYFQTLALSSPHSLPVVFFCDSCFLYLLFIHRLAAQSLWPSGLQHTKLPVFHHLLEFVQVHVHWVNNALLTISSSATPFSFALNLSQHQGLFQWVSSLHQVAKILELHNQSFQLIFMVYLLDSV